MDTEWVLYGSQLSPFALKVALGLTDKGVRFTWSWQHGMFDQLVYMNRIRLIEKDWARLHVPRNRSPLDELVKVPFLLGNDGHNWYDSTYILHELGYGKSLPAHQQLVSLVVEEFFDEWVLYLLHHKRWTDPANLARWERDLTKSPGHYIMAQEMFSPIRSPAFVANSYSNWFNKRQIRRLPYLFSVGDSDPAGLPPNRNFLNEAFDAVLVACEESFAAGWSHLLPYPERTAADYACYGSFGALAHLDAGTREHMIRLAPRLVAWLDTQQHAIQAHTKQPVFPGASTPLEDPKYTATSHPHSSQHPPHALLTEVAECFLPLIKANRVAYRHYASSRHTLFNEKAFNRSTALYTTTIRGTKVGSVVKTFQVHVLDRIEGAFTKLTPAERELVPKILAEAITAPPPDVTFL
eukprot:Sspe_Gene.113403::Locus_97583_Transcript_1_1_Confidence_1.000_Length_1282::g.113403::m.113403